MTKEEVMQAFRLIAMGRPNHPIADQLAEALVKVFAKCEHCTMPEGKHFGPCPNNPDKPAAKTARKKAD